MDRCLGLLDEQTHELRAGRSIKPFSAEICDAHLEQRRLVGQLWQLRQTRLARGHPIGVLSDAMQLAGEQTAAKPSFSPSLKGSEPKAGQLLSHLYSQRAPQAQYSRVNYRTASSGTVQSSTASSLQG
ncbi:uncharacterized protein L969DRAFT_560885 [Mixia osmundae IAM 14324]|uniref:uncharacterized protein n=1 Tax=Mixia osmundae (strain CBS 9802 / IAM 14324 / JCM 22182 / KY 12970) TaxID=764103 RepID=UPI0004A54EDE|nr:uncharacterized protein L969DRAFT_560885 [Mixia osmundae IAM 14324]KEI38025.1 hypothetical protein L969DRAFT_560885 [Mixia osmundae IAM 14324]